MKRILLTGAAGYIGTTFRTWAKDRYDFVCYDRRPTPGVPGAVVADLNDRRALERAAAGCDALVHLAAVRDDADFASLLYPNNVLGPFQVLEAAVWRGVKRVVFASSVQVDEGHRGVRVLPGMAPKPMNLYGVTKALGEDLGRVYAHKFGLSVICLRFGWAAIAADPEWREWVTGRRRMPRIAVTERDLCEILARSVDIEGVDYAVLPAFSRNAAELYDLSPLKTVLDYEPQDDAAELYAAGRLPGF